MGKVPHQELVKNVEGVSDRIRLLAKHGYTRAEISKILGKRYQHVRNVMLAAGITDGLDPNRSSHTIIAPKEKPKRLLSTSVPTLKKPPKPFPEEHLIASGFKKIGNWEFNNEQLTLSGNVPKEYGVYAIARDGVIVYIGVSKELDRRMREYKLGPTGQTTSARVKALIGKAIISGQKITVLIATPGKTEWAGLPVEISPGLEVALIERIQPEWNMKGVSA